VSRFATRTGIDPELEDYIEQARQILEDEYPGVSLVVTSGYRSPQQQAALRARWDRGDRSGLVVRPAAASRHAQGRAADLAFTVRGRRLPVAQTPRDAWAWLADLLEPVGVRWGGTFSPPDWNHFEL
jgi:D-alanyl-D-alanine dipeptidase